MFNPYSTGNKLISLCYQYEVKLASTSVQSDHALYCWCTNFSLMLISIKMIMVTTMEPGQPVHLYSLTQLNKFSS